MIIHSSENVTLVYVEQRKLVYFTIVGFTKSNEISDLVEGLKNQKENILSDKILVDASKFGILRSNDYKLIIDQVIPILREMGVQKAALLNTLDVFGSKYIEGFLEVVDQTKVRVFEEIITAETWLLN